MGIFLRKLWQNKPKQYGPWKFVHASLMENAEKIGIPAQSIVHAAPVWEGAGSIIHDYAINDSLTIANGLWDNNSVVEVDSNSRVHTISEGKLNQGSSNAATYSIFLDAEVNGNASNYRIFALRAGGSGAYSWIHWDYAPKVFEVRSFSAIVASTVQFGGFPDPLPCKTLAFTFNGATEDWEIYTDENLLETVASAPTQWPNAGGMVKVGGPNLGAMSEYRSSLLCYDYILTGTQVGLLSDNPYQLWQPRTSVYYSFPTGGFPTYSITADETITITIPATAVTAAEAIVCDTFDVTADGASAIFTGIGSTSSVTSTPGTLVTNKANILNGVSSSCDVLGSIGTLIVGGSLTFTGTSTISAVNSYVGTLIANQTLTLTGISTISTVASSIGTLIANQELLLTGTSTISAVNSYVGTLIAETPPVGAEFIGVYSKAVVHSTPGILIANKTVQLEGISTISTVKSSIGTLTIGIPQLIVGVPTISSVTASSGIIAIGHAVRAPPTLSIVSASIGAIVIGTTVEGVSCIAASISNLGTFFNGIKLIKPILNPGVNKVTAVFTVNKKTKIYTVNKSTKILTIR